MNPAHKMPGIRANVAPYAIITNRKACRCSYSTLTRGKGNRAARRVAPHCYQTEPGRFTFPWLANATPDQRRSNQHLLPSIRAYFINKHHPHPALNTDR